MDGTLTVPSLDFNAIRREIGILSGDLTHEIEQLAPALQARAWAIIEQHEERAMQDQALQEGAEAFLKKCRRRSLRLGVVTRNVKRSVDHLCERYALRFDAVVTREFHVMKPHPGPVLHMLEAWGLAPAAALMVGDYRYDIQCGVSAGTWTCFFQNPDVPFSGEDADFVVSSMTELDRLVFPEQERG